MKNLLKMISIIFKHKFYVGCACFRLGLYVHAFTHDLSKLSPFELFESAKFYGISQGKYSPIDAAKREQGYSMAWFHHRGRNKHHYEYWVDYLDNGGIPATMPYKYCMQMVCDYIGAGKAYIGKEWTSYEPLRYWRETKLLSANIDSRTMMFFDLCFKTLYTHGYKELKKSSYDLYFECMTCLDDKVSKYLDNAEIEAKTAKEVK